MSRQEDAPETRKSRTRFVGLCLLVASLLTGIVWLAPLALTGAARSLIRVDTPSKADVAIALGGDPRCWREKEAALLYQRGMVTHLVVSGIPYGQGINSGDAAKRYVVGLGIPEKDVSVMREEWNTRIEARDLSSLMRERGWKSAIVVTSPFHSRRALYTMKQAAPDLGFRSVPAFGPPPEWQAEMWWTRRGDAWVTIREFLSWINTIAGGLR
jgi:uncharacterized SAM-binding protein YcdF (DUF218 family)